jgi:hypothetical protein
MANLFAELQDVKEQQEAVLKRATPPPSKANKGLERDAQKVAQKPAQVSKGMSKPLSKALSKPISQEAVEELAFQLRRTQQAKLNANVPVEWKEKLDDLAFRLKVGKYELLTYIVGVFLGEVEQPET